MLSINIKDSHQCEDTYVYAIVRTSPQVTHVVHAGDLLVLAGTMLMTPTNLLCSVANKHKGTFQ